MRTLESKSMKADSGGLVLLACGFDKYHPVKVPSSIFDKNDREGTHYPQGKVKKEYWDRDFKRFYISPGGFIYCGRKCFARFCDD